MTAFLLFLFESKSLLDNDKYKGRKHCCGSDQQKIRYRKELRYKETNINPVYAFGEPLFE